MRTALIILFFVLTGLSTNAILAQRVDGVVNTTRKEVTISEAVAKQIGYNIIPDAIYYIRYDIRTTWKKTSWFTFKSKSDTLKVEYRIKH